MKKFNEDFLRSKGFTQQPDGSWGKESGAHHSPASGSNPQSDQGKPQHWDRTQDAPGPVRRIVAIITVRTVRPRDYDGLGASSKHYLDALRQCGLYADDSPEYLEVVAVAERVRSFQEEETIIELFELPEGL
jgi:hypothetical protein